ncbi:PP2C family protein-serine/threonine phosphatase [Actinomadura violacea]|uniref:Serine/threonine-protein phosphatase n=1 Tax=Actinomadura violacea TaxID=2819934 RepID=A0ABS3RK84_9ACTN|nr:protein phosphatase 2C domain-containing protein [Actinomadura violacea]MBO2457138.1 serine/threonine-protein phosphatase [Actinomadura violacea]
MAHLWLRYAAGTDIGRRRRVNEDSAFAGPALLAVADGMGGHPHGDVASAAAITAVADPPAGGDPAAALAAAVARASARLEELAAGDPELHGMGTTLTAMAWDGAGFAVAHIGDSRAYLLRGGALFQITRDHTMVQSLVDGGRITPDEAADHPRASLLVRALQSGGDQRPDLFRQDAAPGDRYLLCSDGVSGFVPAGTIRDVLAGAARPAVAVARLIALADAAGGLDNITCVVADVVAGLPDPADPPGRAPLLVGAVAGAGGRGAAPGPTVGPTVPDPSPGSAR